MRRLNRNSESAVDYRWQEEPSDSVDVRLNLIRQYAQRSGGAGEIWFREVIQNAVDSGATEVFVGTIRNSEGRVCGICTDNGSGMDLQTLKDAFLRVSGSGKPRGSGTFGGFGEAKKLILLAWKGYEISTRKDGLTIEVHGEFKDSKIKESNAKIGNSDKGTQIVAYGWTDEEIKSAGDTPDRYRLSHLEAKKYILQCSLPNVKFYIVTPNGGEMEEIVTKTDLRSYKPLKKDIVGIDGIPICDILIKKLDGSKLGGNYTDIDFRTNGLKMFSQTVFTGTKKYSIIVEINTKEVGVKKILTNNRDQLADTVLKNAVDAAIQEFTRDSTTAYLQSIVPKRERAKGFGAVNVSRDIIEQLSDKVEPLLSTHNKPADESSLEEICVEIVRSLQFSRNENSPIDILPGLTGSLMAIAIMSGETGQTREVIERYSKIPDYTYESYDMPEDFELEAKFKVKTMTKEVKRLLYAWVEILRLIAARRGVCPNMGVGFIAASDFVGMMIPNDDNRLECDAFICINPYKNGVLLDPSKMDDIKYMTKIAVHEMTHYLDGVGEHNAAFASALQNLFTRVMPAFPLLVSICKIVGTSDELQKSTFSKGVDIKSYSDFERSLDFDVSKTMSPRERAIEAKMEGVIKLLINNGANIEKIESVLASSNMSDQAVARIREHAKTQEKSKANTGRMDELMDASRKRKVEALSTKVQELENLIAEMSKERAKLAPLSSPLRLNGSKRRLK